MVLSLGIYICTFFTIFISEKASYQHIIVPVVTLKYFECSWTEDEGNKAEGRRKRDEVKVKIALPSGNAT